MRNTRFAVPRRLFLASAVLLACLGPNAALAADYPTRPIKIVIPFSPGGGTDVIFRIIGQRLGEKLGQPVIIDNRAGAAGTIGATHVAQAQPDGYTLLGYHIAMVTAHHVQKIPYNPLKDFTPIGQVAAATNAVVVNADLPVKNFAEFVALAKKEPEKLHFGSSGSGGSDHLGGLLLQMATGTKLTHIPYKGGGPANVAAASGEIQLTAGTIAQSGALVKAGKLRALVVMQPERNAEWPDIPSAAEAGYPGLNYQTWFGMWGPANMPPDVLQKISSALKEVLERDDVVQALSKAGVGPKFSTPKEYAKMTTDEYERWNTLLKGKL
ncbi:MAG: bug51 [Herminiimonas sp.]|nr:bug51 [Herminiimonas sp.]